MILITFSIVFCMLCLAVFLPKKKKKEEKPEEQEEIEALTEELKYKKELLKQTIENNKKSNIENNDLSNYVGNINVF